MSTQANVCDCSVCTGGECTCGCQSPAAPPTASCQCGEVCGCGPACTCQSCQHVDDRQPESR
jgi:hypothetical protein